MGACGRESYSMEARRQRIQLYFHVSMTRRNSDTFRDVPKNTTRAILYSFEESSRSLSMPAIFAFPMLQLCISECPQLDDQVQETHFVLSIYDRMYMNHIIGKRSKSIFRTSFFSSSGVHVTPCVVVSSYSKCLVLSMTLVSTPTTSREGFVDGCGETILFSGWRM